MSEGPASTTVTHCLATGVRVGPYEIEALIGAGGMGEVYKAHDSRLGRTVAIKILPPAMARDADRRRRFELEARAASSLDHPNVCAIHDIGEHDGRVFIAMEWVDGPHLGHVIASGVAMDRALSLSRQIAAGMAAAHRAGIVHRDIKPANILLTSDERIKIVDFGLAMMPSPADAETQTRLTRERMFVGTPTYASPQQLGGRPLDARTDVFSIGCVMYELFSGRPAFGSVSREVPPPLHAIQPHLPPSVGAIVERALAHAPDARYPSAVTLLADLEAAEAALLARRVPLRAFLRRPVVVGAIGALLVMTAIAGGLASRQRARERWVRGTAIPQAKSLLAKGEPHHFAAFRLLREATALTPSDPQLRELMDEASVTLPMSTIPPGAELYVRDFRDPEDAWEYLGRSPVTARLPANTGFLWKITRPGFAPVVRVVYSQLHPPAVELAPTADTPPDMVFIPGGRRESPGHAAMLESFWIDRFEVTNRAYGEFVRSGGYERTEFWAGLAREVIAHFTDRTGRPGPSTWALSLAPEGKDDHPVAGLSWYEARAYCSSVGKDLPTLYHWYQASEPGWTTQWASFSNFQSEGTTRVGQPLHLNTFGTYDMAGNVREWTRTEGDPGYTYALGGSYAEPIYTFSDFWVHPPMDRADHLGVRCAKYTAPLPDTVSAPVTRPVRDYRLEAPAGDTVYAVLAGLYTNLTTRPLDAREEEIDDRNSQFRLLRISFAASYADERVRAFLFLPRNAAPPYQVVIWYPGAGRFLARGPFTIEGETTWFQFMVRTGRAVLLPEYKGTYERWIGSIMDAQVWREVMVHSAKDLQRAVDYLEERPDVDANAIAFYGVSMGAAAGGIMTAVEPRFKASILLGGGLYLWKRPPEAEIFNFLPRVRVPTLMVNGKLDYYFPEATSQAPMFDLIGTSLKKRLLYDSGHIPSERDAYTGQMLEWLDRHLGPVTQRR